MESLPIENLLSGKRLDLARLQDVVIQIIYNHVQYNAILYGGTAIWRCYNGGRFSEDIDIYVNRRFYVQIENFLSKYGLNVVWRDPEQPNRIRISDGATDLLLEAKVGEAENSIVQYKKVDGSSITIYALTPTELLKRKIEAYDGRRYIRDLYDIFQLTNYLNKKDHSVSHNLKEFLSAVKKPIDEKLLETLIYAGSSKLSSEDIIKYLKTWIK